MKKYLCCLLLVFSFLYSFSAQETFVETVADEVIAEGTESDEVVLVGDESEEEVNQQYETFSWEPVAKAKQYGVILEKYDAVLDIWKDYKTVKTTKTSLEVLFTPGTFRVSICTYNVMGRKGKSSPWVVFQILEENIPYLNEKFLPKSNAYKAPVLVLNMDDEQQEKDNYITAPENQAPNTILVKGRNIFSPKTEFYLVPEDKPSDETLPFVGYAAQRKSQKLRVVQRNSKDFSVVVAYDKALLDSGYYKLEVHNPGDNKDAVDILVLKDTSFEVAPSQGFALDEHYNVNSFDTGSTYEYDFTVTGSGLSSILEYYLEPARGVYPYPFETQTERSNVPLEVKTYENDSQGKLKVSLGCDTAGLRNGYYNIVAQSPDGTSAKFLCLVKKNFDVQYVNSIKKIKTKYNKRADYVDVTITGTDLSPSKKYTLVSQYNSDTDSNNKISVPLELNGNKLTGKLYPKDLAIAKYALLIEDAFSSEVVWCNLDSSLKLSVTKMTESSISKTFFRPVGLTNQSAETILDQGLVQYYDNKTDYTKRLPYFFTTMKLDLSLQKDNAVAIYGELDLVNLTYTSLSVAYEYKYNDTDTFHFVNSVFRVTVPNMYFQPYIGVGVGSEIHFDDLKNSFGKDDIYAFAQIGAQLLTILDVRYNLTWHSPTGKPYFTEEIYFGSAFPIRSFKFKRKTLTKQAVITKPGLVQGTDFIDPKSNVDKVEFEESSSVSGFAGYNRLEEVTFGTSVTTIEENAFSDCENLQTVHFMEVYDPSKAQPLVIKGGAFAQDSQITSLTLPARTKEVRAGAFAGWTRGQIIILGWTKDDTTERDLTGLINCPATVLYSDNEVFTAQFKNPLENEKNWVNLDNLSLKNVSVYTENEYDLGLKMQGVGYSWYRTELDTWINQESPAELIDYIKTGDTIKFLVQGDGNSYDFIMTTQDGGYFYYRFKTKKDKVTEVIIPYKRLGKYNFSSQKKLDIDNLKMCCIMPMCKSEWNNAAFFKFEVTGYER
ncbi:MAG: leucine-rich repeat protein [Treponema sp.]|nr:leucine-rich repeat protein [Treponema sp.]